MISIKNKLAFIFLFLTPGTFTIWGVIIIIITIIIIIITIIITIFLVFYSALGRNFRGVKSLKLGLCLIAKYTAAKFLDDKTQHKVLQTTGKI